MSHMWRFLQNDRMKRTTLVQPLWNYAREFLEMERPEFVLVVHDWSQLHFRKHQDKEPNQLAARLESGLQTIDGAPGVDTERPAHRTGGPGIGGDRWCAWHVFFVHSAGAITHGCPAADDPGGRKSRFGNSLRSRDRPGRQRGLLHASMG
jgi:hypothetical protein